MNKCAQLWKYARKVHIESIKNKLGKRKDKRKTPLRPWPPSLLIVLYPNLHLLLDHLNRNSNISLCDSVTQESICFFFVTISDLTLNNALCVKEKKLWRAATNWVKFGRNAENVVHGASSLLWSWEPSSIFMFSNKTTRCKVKQKVDWIYHVHRHHHCHLYEPVWNCVVMVLKSWFNKIRWKHASDVKSHIDQHMAWIGVKSFWFNLKSCFKS